MCGHVTRAERALLQGLGLARGSGSIITGSNKIVNAPAFHAAMRRPAGSGFLPLLPCTGAEQASREVIAWVFPPNGGCPI